MRIYAIADIHAKPGILEKITRVAQKEPLDLIILAGDITQYFFPLKTLNALSGINTPIFAVLGNSDLFCSRALIRKHGKIRLLNNNPLKFNSIPFIGLNGTIPLPFVSKISLNESGIFKKIKPFVTPDTILVAHPPPRGLCDKVGQRISAGSFLFRHFIENHPPLMVICGHIHEEAGYTRLKNTTILNCAVNRTYTGAIIEFDEKTDDKTLLQIKMIPNQSL